jgi:hypothetical protein
MASERKDFAVVLTLKVSYDDWLTAFQRDSENRAAHGALDESRTKTAKVDDKTAVIFFFDVDQAAHRAFLNEPGRKEIIDSQVESSKVYIATVPPPHPTA